MPDKNTPTTRGFSSDLAEKIIDKIDGIKDEMHEYKLESQKEHEEMKSDLKEHMRRSEASEKRLDLLEVQIKPVLESFTGIKWMLGALAFVIALLSTAIAIFHR